jgi:DNA replication protein DnaC
MRDAVEQLQADLADLVTITCECGAPFEAPRKFASKFCETCTAARQEADRIARARRDAWAKTVVPDFYEWVSFKALANLPPAERARRVKDASAIPKAKAAVDAQRVVLMGKDAGIGKTVLATAILRAHNDRGTPGAFVDAYELATARGRARLGDEAGVVDRAMRAPVLVIDDLLAKSGPHDAAPDVVHVRHAKMLKTIVTLGFSRDDVKARLGDGIARRIFEGALVIEMGRGVPA